MEFKDLLQYIQRTNPEFTLEKLKEELRKSTTSALGLVMTASNFSK